MATLNAYTPFNSDTFFLWEGDITAATPEYVRVVLGPQVQELIGTGIAFDAEGDITGGTLTQTNYGISGTPQYDFAGLNHTLTTIIGFADVSDWQGLLAFLFSGNDTFNGSGGNDILNGYAGDDAIFGGGGNDVLRGQSGIDALYGGEGGDTAGYSAGRAAYVIEGIAPNFSISGPDGSDALFSIERLRFSDMGLAFDLGQDEAAGNTVRVIGAAFNENLIIPAYVGIGLQFFDAGMSMSQVCELVATQVMRLSDEAFVTQVYTNVVGVAPDTATRDVFVSMLQESGGGLTQGQLLEIAAELDLNAQQINLVGLQASGVEFI